ncbi:MAG: hypothetical protein ABJD07_04845 [Gemmatimonadaceae bacterium]
MPRPPTYTVRMHDVAVGYSDLEERDADGTMAHGVFRPGLGYELVQPIFQLHARATPGDDVALARFVRARDALRLTLIDPKGKEIATRGIHIYERDTGRLAIEVQLQREH